MVRKKLPKKSSKKNPKSKKRLITPSSSLPYSIDLKPHLDSVVGRPTSYKPIYCQKIIMLMAEGKSKTTAAVELGVEKGTLLAWAAKNPEFLFAIKKAEQLSQRWWEEVGRANIGNKQFNAVLYMMNMSNRFGWSRSQEGGAGEESIEDAVKSKVIKHEHTHRHEVNIGERTNEHLASVLRILAESGALTTAAEESTDPEADQIH